MVYKLSSSVHYSETHFVKGICKDTVSAVDADML